MGAVHLQLVAMLPRKDVRQPLLLLALVFDLLYDLVGFEQGDVDEADIDLAGQFHFPLVFASENPGHDEVFDFEGF